MLAKEYMNKIQKFIPLLESQLNVIELVGAKIADCILSDGIVHAFGSGHSDMIAKEITLRAGGLVPISKINDPMQGKAERIEGYAALLLEEYERMVGFTEHDIFIIISNSGRNALPIEMCYEAKKRSLQTVAITSVAHYRNIFSRHSSGKKLCEISDYVVDNSVEVGDAIIKVPLKEIKSGAISTISGALLINMLVLSAIEKIISKGEEPPILKSGNIDGADEYNDRLKKKYARRISW